MNRIIYLIIGVVFLNIHASAQQKLKNDKKKPNIIFILTDDLGYGDLGVFFQKQREQAEDKSKPWMHTPNLDKMATQGVQFTHQYSAAPVCAPSRASILLGQSQGHANVRDNQFDKALEDNHTMASVLHKAGYATAAIGKWGLQGDKRWDKNGAEWPAHPLNRGFDYFFGYMKHVDGHEHYPKEGLYRKAADVWENRTNIVDQLDKCYTADLWTAAAKRWIIEQKDKSKDQPFFIYLAYDTPHAVLELPTQPYPAGGGENGGLQWLGKSGHMINTASGEPDSWIHPDYADAVYDDDNNTATKEVPWPDVYKRYATSVRRIDDAVGDIMTLLKDLKIDSNTMIVFTSDNGPSVESYLPEEFEPTFFGGFGPLDGIKRDTWEGGVRVPSIVSWSDHISPNRVIESPSALYDWLPTFIEAAGIPAPARIDGVSLLPSLTGVGKQKASLVYVEYFNKSKTPNFEEFGVNHRNRQRNQMQLLRVGDTVGVRYDIQSADDDFEIYNVVTDPRQRKNLAMNPGMNLFQKRLKERVLQVRRPDTAAARPYDKELVPALHIAKAGEQGLRWTAFTGNYPWVPAVDGLTSKASGLAKNAIIEKANEAYDVVVFEGLIKIPVDGTYNFHLKTNGNAILKIHEGLIIDADYGYKSGDERIGKVLLKAGLHPIKLYYKKAVKGNQLLSFEWDGPGIVKQTIPGNIFYVK